MLSVRYTKFIQKRGKKFSFQTETFTVTVKKPVLFIHLPNQQRTLNKVRTAVILLISIQIGTKCAKTCIQYVYKLCIFQLSFHFAYHR